MRIRENPGERNSISAEKILTWGFYQVFSLLIAIFLAGSLDGL
jgi:hypothetical protein